MKAGLIKKGKSVKRSISYKKTLNDKTTIRNYVRGLSSTSAEAAQIYRANNGGGMPCPDKVCSTPSILDNF